MTNTKLQSLDTSLDPSENIRKKPSQSDDKRSLGTTDEHFHKRLKTETESVEDRESRENVSEQERTEKKQSDTYQHVQTSSSHYDHQVLDAATEEQMQEQIVPNENDEECDKVTPNDEVEPMDQDHPSDSMAPEQKIPAHFQTNKKREHEKKDVAGQLTEEIETQTERGEVEGECVPTTMVPRGSDSSIHTQMNLWPLSDAPIDVEKLRQTLEEQLPKWTATSNEESFEMDINQATELWHKYEEMTLSLAQDLCEQLRLILEPSLTAKLKGDYRTGKRLNMRKVMSELVYRVLNGIFVGLLREIGRCDISKNVLIISSTCF